MHDILSLIAQARFPSLSGRMGVPYQFQCPQQSKPAWALELGELVCLER